ncbi:hypothetical protein VTL71DRAFT_8303 [Oculimacula yallundae]|uniref:Dehydrin n=1 Tax=Oculimacula yallundae TaxID=86028 RepID=A0ABR4CXB5_9HELO
MAESLKTTTAIADDSIGHTHKTGHNVSPTAPGTTDHEHEKKGLLGKIKDKISPSSDHHGGSQPTVGGDGTHIGRDEAVKNAFGGTAVNEGTMHRGPAAVKLGALNDGFWRFFFLGLQLYGYPGTNDV